MTFFILMMSLIVFSIALMAIGVSLQKLVMRYRRFVQYAVPQPLEAGVSDKHLEIESTGKAAPGYDRMPH